MSDAGEPGCCVGAAEFSHDSDRPDAPLASAPSVITVPAGFTTSVWDRERAGDETRLVGPIPAALPVGVDFIARPFGEPMLFRIAAAYEAATRNRRPPADFGPLP